MHTTAERSPNGESEPQTPLSLREAARLAGVPREYLEECVAAGKLGVHLHHKGDVMKFRVTRAALISAGILPDESRPPIVDPNEQLVELLKTQTERLTAIEEQRFQLAGQLGAALERNRLLEERALALTATSKPDDTVEPAATRASRGLVAQKMDASELSGESPTTEASPLTTYKLAVRIIRSKPAARWSIRTFSVIPKIGSFISARRKRGAST